jgi:hypothetical protein
MSDCIEALFPQSGIAEARCDRFCHLSNLAQAHGEDITCLDRIADGLAELQSGGLQSDEHPGR